MFSEVVDIVYSEINRMCNARKDRIEQKEIAKTLVKKALLEFYYDWKTRSKYSGFNTTDVMLKDYSKKFIDVSVEIRAYDILPDSVTNDLLSFLTRMRDLAGQPKVSGYSYEKATDELLDDVFLMYNSFDMYFEAELFTV